MKKHNTIKVVLITMLVFLLLSWILPAAYYSGQYVDQGRVQMGLFDLFNYPLTALSYFGYIGLFIILVGGFYGILYKIPAYRTFLDRIVKLFEGKEKIALGIMIVVISVLVSICGLHYGIALFIPFVVAIILLMGYDKITAALVTVGSIVAGLVGTTYAVNNTNILTSSLGLDADYQIGVRFVILLVGIVLVIFNTLMYVNKIKKSKIEVIKEEVKEKVEKIEKAVAKKASAKKAPAKKSTAKKTTTKKAKKKAEKETRHFKKHKTGRIILAFATSAACMIALAAIVKINLPNVSVKVAAVQTGVEASYPSYVPRDYSLTGVYTNDQNSVIIEFNGPEGKKFTLSEDKSSWDSSALLTNYVKGAYGTNYDVIREQGITVYISSSNAAWVNNGIFYRITAASGTLSKKQIKNIVGSL